MYYSPVAVRKTMPHGPVMYITMKKAVARCSWFVARKTMPHRPVMYITMKKAVARYSWFVARKTMPHGPVMYITIYSRRAALWDGPLRRPRSGRFYELRVTRSDVVSLSLSPRGGI